MWILGTPVILLSLAGFGSWAVRGSTSLDALAASSLAGALTVMGIVGSLHLFVAVPRSLTLPTAFTGCVLLLRARGRLRVDVRDLSRVLAFTLLVVAAYRIAAIPSRLGRGPLLHYDAFLYHGGLVEWFEHAPLPLGLGLLHSRFGFNPGIVQLMAAFRAPDGSWSHHLLVEASVVTIGLLLTLRAFLAARDSSAPAAGFILGLLLFSLGFLLATAPRAGTDLAAAITAVAAVAAAVVVRSHHDSDRSEPWLGVLVMLVALAIMQKASMVGVVTLLAAPFSQRSSVQRDAWVRPVVLIPTMLAGLSGAVWLLRSFLMSGCLAYPIGLTCRDVAWGIGAEAAAIESGVIRSWARTGSTGGSLETFDMSWLPGWFGSYLSGHSLALVGFLVVGIVVFLVGRVLPRAPSEPLQRGFGGLVAVHLLATFVIWFLGAPDPRFAIHLHITVSALLASSVLAAWTATGRGPSPIMLRPVSRRRVALLAGAIAVTISLIEVNEGPTFPVSGAIDTRFDERFVPVVPQQIGDRTEVEEWKFLVPLQGDQCGNSIPCTPAPGDFDVSVSGRRITLSSRD